MNRLSARSLVLLIAFAVVATVACGGGGGGDAAPSPAPPAAAPTAAGSATITGTVNAGATEDPDVAIRMDADPVCAGLHSGSIESQKVLKDADGNLANAFVYVKSGLTGGYSPPAEAAILSQQGCRYIPHVSGVMVGQTLKVVNNDPTLHNVHATPSANAEFNQAQPFQDMELDRTFDAAEVMIPFKCDVHPWMSSYVAVLEHPYYDVTGEDGSFTIAGLPAGSYTLEVWHETLGTQTIEASVEADGSTAVEASF